MRMHESCGGAWSKRLSTFIVSDSLAFWAQVSASIDRTAAANFRLGEPILQTQQCLCTFVFAQTRPRSYGQKSFDSPNMVDKWVTGPFATARQPQRSRALWVVSLPLVDVLPRILKREP